MMEEVSCSRSEPTFGFGTWHGPTLGGGNCLAHSALAAAEREAHVAQSVSLHEMILKGLEADEASSAHRTDEKAMCASESPISWCKTMMIPVPLE